MQRAAVRIAVITPCGSEPVDTLRQCHESVLAQTLLADHFIVGPLAGGLKGWRAKQVELPVAPADHGTSARSAGSVLAHSEGYDFIAYLDAPHAYEPEHLQNLLDTFEQTGSPVCASLRSLRRIDGSILRLEEEPAQAGADSNCLLLHRRAFSLCATWHRMPRRLTPIAGRIFFRALQNAGLAVSLSLRHTVRFMTREAADYRQAGESPPAGAQSDAPLVESLNYLFSTAGVRETVETLGFWPGTEADEALRARLNQASA